ncbi:MAG: SpoIIE family protein phosphatase [Bacteroidia bacterium]|nr:SpoIIE family protein phosphatase [Bacteroidia bacterium]
MQTIKIFIFFYFICTTSLIVAQQLPFWNYGVDDGLPSSKIYGIIQDSKGFIWIATTNGVCRFDGIKFTTFTMNNGILDNEVIKMYEDKEERIWMISLSGKLSYYYQNKFFNYDSLDILKRVRVCGIMQDRNHNLWLGTWKAGIIKITQDSVIQFSNEKLNSKGAIAPYVEDSTGAILCASFLEFIVITDSTINHHSFQANDVSYNRRILHNQDDNIYYTIGGSIIKFNRESQDELICNINKNLKTESDISWLVEYEKNNYWVSTFNNGALQIKNGFENWNQAQYYLEDQNLSMIIADHEENIWFSTLGNGLYFLPANSRYCINYNKETGLIDNNINCVTKDKAGRILLGTSNGNLNFINNNEVKEILLNPRQTNRTVTCILSHSNGSTWVGTTLGIMILKDKTVVKDFFTFVGIKDLHEDKNGNVWVSTSFRVFHLENFEIIKLHQTARNHCIFIDHSNKTWIGGENGLMYIQNDSIYVFNGLNDVFNYQVTDIKESSDSTLWIATQGNGIVGLKKQKINFHIKAKDGLVSDFCNSLFVNSEKNVLVGSNSGISDIRFHNDRDRQFSIENINIRNGLISNEVRGIFKQNDTTWITTRMGVTMLFEQYQKHKLSTPSINLTGFKVNNIELKRGSNIVLDHDMNDIQFDFVGISYKSYGQIKYKYKLIGSDSSWKYTSATTLHFPSLIPGNYEFSVIAQDIEGKWSKMSTNLKFVILPPFWQTWYFQGSLSLLILLSGVGFYRWRIASLKRDKKLLQQKVEERTKELAQKNKDITDSITYAKQIQSAILPPLENISSIIKDYFVLYKPRDIVSGDFYWFHNIDQNKYIIAACDCTGHGVPGSLMSMVGNDLLNQIVVEKRVSEPGDILEKLHTGIRRVLRQDSIDVKARDGMDMALCIIDINKMEFQYSGAHNPLFYVTKHELIDIPETKTFRIHEFDSEYKLLEVKGNKYGIGGEVMGKERKYESHSFNFNAGDSIYLFSDGYQDQFGGPRDKKLSPRKLREVLIQNQNTSMKNLKNTLDEEIEKWKADSEQTDDILVIGIKL